MTLDMIKMEGMIAALSWGVCVSYSDQYMAERGGGGMSFISFSSIEGVSDLWEEIR